MPFSFLLPLQWDPHTTTYSFSNWESLGIILFSRTFNGSRNLCWVPSSGLFSCGEEDCPSHLKFATVTPR